MLRHFILTNGRSGSNLLTNTLNMHPNVVNFGEVLGDWTLPRKFITAGIGSWNPDERYLERLYSSWSFYWAAQTYSAISHLRRSKPMRVKPRRQVRTIGFKDFAFLIERFGLQFYLEKMEDIKIIHLRRENTLKRLVSLERMHATKVVSSDTEQPLVHIELDTESLLTRLRILKQEDSFAAELVGRISADRTMEIVYEDYSANSQRMKVINDRVFHFLGVEPMNEISVQKKISPANLKNIVKNYGDVCRTLAGTEFEGCVD